MIDWKKEKPLIGPEGLIKVLHPISSTTTSRDQLICDCSKREV
jgi:hypothetical protein